MSIDVYVNEKRAAVNEQRRWGTEGGGVSLERPPPLRVNEKPLKEAGHHHHSSIIIIIIIITVIVMV